VFYKIKTTGYTNVPAAVLDFVCKNGINFVAYRRYVLGLKHLHLRVYMRGDSVAEPQLIKTLKYKLNNFKFFFFGATALGGLWPPLFEGFVTMIVLRGGVVNPTPNPQLSWRTNVFCRGCLP
jgi:hypothetical protein